MTMSIAGTVEQGFGYTADGSVNLLNPGSVAPSGYLITDLTYNQDARPSTLNSNGQPAIGFAYDGFGQRLSAENIPNAYDIIYQYGQDGLIQEEASSNGTIQADYIYLNNRPIAVLSPGTATLSFLHDDRLGTPQIATDSGQNTVWQTTYDPFGNTSSIGGTITQDLRLPGQIFDEIGGEYLNGFRDYLPSIGRYIEPDPLAMRGITRLYNSRNGSFLSRERLGIFPTAPEYYIYVGNNPLNFIDPLGLCKDSPDKLPNVPKPPDPVSKYAKCSANVRSDVEKGSFLNTVATQLSFGNTMALCGFTAEGAPVCVTTIEALELSG